MHAFANERGGVGGIERGAAQLDLLLRGEQIVKRDLDARDEAQRGRGRGRARGGELGACGGAAARRGDETDQVLDRRSTS